MCSDRSLIFGYVVTLGEENNLIETQFPTLQKIGTTQLNEFPEILPIYW